MAAITFLRDKKWIISGFALLGVALLFLSAIPALYQTASQDKDIIIEGKLYKNDQYQRLLKRFNYDKDKLRQQLRQETLTNQILNEAGIQVTDKDVRDIMHNTNDKNVQKVLNEYAGRDLEEYKKTLKQIEEDPPRLAQYKVDLKNALRREKAIALLPPEETHLLLAKKGPQIMATYTIVPLEQIVAKTDGCAPTQEEQRKYLTENQHLFSSAMSAQVLCQIFHISPSYQECENARDECARYQKTLEQKYREDDEGAVAKRYAESTSDDDKVEIKWYRDKIPPFLKGKKKGYVSSPKRVGNQYKVYFIKETKDSEGKFVVYVITKNIPCKANATHIRQRVEQVQKEHCTQNFNQIHKKYGYYHNYKGDQITLDIHPDMVNYPPNDKYGAIARKIYNDHYKKGQYFKIEIKDPKTNTLQKILLCTLLRRGKGNTLAYNQKKVQDGLKAEQKLKTLEAYLAQKGNTSIEEKLTQQYGSTHWSDSKKIGYDNTELYGHAYPKEITEILLDDKTKPFYAFLNKDKTHVIVVRVSKTNKSSRQEVAQNPQSGEEKFTQINQTYI